jgi:transketolase
MGLPLGCAELGTVLFGEVLKHDPGAPQWPDRDRFVLSGGHGSMLLYSLLHLAGYPLPMDEIRRFRQLGSATPGHPEHGVTVGVETTTGPLGQGFGNAVGMALAERVLAARFGAELFDHRTYVLASDGDLMEGVASEAASLAGHLGLDRLIVLYDDNSVTIDGPTSLSFSEDVGRRFEAYGWEVQRIDGHAPDQIRRALEAARATDNRPHLIVCRTEIGRGSSVAGQAKAHGSPGDEVLAGVRDQLGWTLPPFEVPDAARDAFRANAQRGRGQREAWDERLARALREPAVEKLWKASFERALPDNLEALLPGFKDRKPLATRSASGEVLNALAGPVPSLIGGSADLAGSNNTTLAGQPFVARGKFEGRNLAFGVREHGMAAIANGLSLHGGLRPYVATFLVFSDYMRPSVRLAALMRQPVTFIFTHDSVFVGEDGPTHQPVEHVAALRTIPDLEVWRPADARETAAAWLAALRREHDPVALILTRQNLPVLPEVDETRAQTGGYVLFAESDPKRLELVLIGTGSETHLALGAARALQAEGRSVRVVSLPCLERFLAQDTSAREAVLPTGVRRLAVEAGVPAGLAQVLAPGDHFHGIDRFGASAPYQELQKYFRLTTEDVLAEARKLLA